MSSTRIIPLVPGVALPEIHNLRPCPFCGSEAATECDRRSPHRAYHHWHVICLNSDECGAIGPASETETVAKQLWNERAAL